MTFRSGEPAAAGIPLFQVDAFTDRPFAGNPAAVCPLDAWLPDDLMRKIAAENNLSETAFIVPRGDSFDLRWFTPAVEIDLCGHATLAAAFVLMTRIEPGRTAVTFHTRSGPLGVTREADVFTLDFPARPPSEIAEPEGLAEALGVKPDAVLKARDTIAVLDSSEAVRRLAPDMERLKAVDAFAVCVTAPGGGPDGDVDFVSRFFAPAQGIPEDPVTGSSHCSLAPYWAGRLGKKVLRARQVSPRGGDLRCELVRDRVRIAGRAVLVVNGTLHLG